MSIKIYDKVTVKECPTTGFDRFYVGDKEISDAQYKAIKYASKRRDLCFLVDEDPYLCYSHKALLIQFFSESAKDGDIQGAPRSVYHRYKRALLCFLQVED